MSCGSEANPRQNHRTWPKYPNKTAWMRPEPGFDPILDCDLFLPDLTCFHRIWPTSPGFDLFLPDLTYFPDVTIGPLMPQIWQWFYLSAVVFSTKFLWSKYVTAECVFVPWPVIAFQPTYMWSKNSIRAVMWEKSWTSLNNKHVFVYAVERLVTEKDFYGAKPPCCNYDTCKALTQRSTCICIVKWDSVAPVLCWYLLKRKLWYFWKLFWTKCDIFCLQSVLSSGDNLLLFTCWSSVQGANCSKFMFWTNMHRLVQKLCAERKSWPLVARIDTLYVRIRLRRFTLSST